MSTSLFVKADFNAAILRQAFFRDVQMAEDFDARNNRRLEPLELGRHRNFLQDAVNPVADAKFIFEGFEMNVRRAQFHGVRNTWLTNRMMDASSAA